ncbi:MAG: class II fructose-bisphosphate aldolase [Desulfobaccales bacterium]
MQHDNRMSSATKGCIGAFSVSNSEVAKAVLDIAAEEGSPVGLCINADLLETPAIEALSAVAMSMAKISAVPVVVTLSHARSLDMVKLALDLGFSSVMFDGSFLPFARNVEMTARAVDMAGPGVAVEGEIGAFTDFGKDSSGQFLICDLAETFSRETGIDSLAVGIASDGGRNYCLVMDILERLRLCAPGGLSLQDASLLTSREILPVIAAGVNKLYFNDCPGNASRGDQQSVHRATPGFRDKVRQMIKILGTATTSLSPGAGSF